MTMTGVYDLRLVALSVAIAVLVSYTALDLAGRVTAARGRLRTLWLAGGAVAMGSGIWSMHFIGMLAFSLPTAMAYDAPTVVASLLVAVVASALALFVVSRPALRWRGWLGGGLLMGLAIASMHYTGMAALRLAVVYDPLRVALSVTIAIGASLVALWLAFRLRGQIRARHRLTVGSALVMGAAISGMHYTGMTAAMFPPAPLAPLAPGVMAPRPDDVTPLVFGAAIGSVTIIMLGVTLLASLVDQRLAARATEAAELRRSEERLRALGDQLRRQLAFTGAITDTLGDGVYALDRAGRVTFMNPAIERLLGWSARDLEGVVRHDALQVPAPGSALEMADCVRRGVLAGGRTVSRDAVVTRQDGTLVPVAYTAAPLVTDGQVEGAVVAVRDMTARVRVEEALRVSETGLAEAQRLAHLGNWWRDVTTGEARWSDELYRIHGYAPGEVDLSDRLPALTHPADQERVRAWMGEIVTGRATRIDHRIVRPDGAVRHVRQQVEVVRDEAGRVHRLIGVVLDSTEQAHAEEALRASERDHRALMEQAADGIFLLDPAGHFLDVNARACALLGYSHDELLRFSIPDVMDATDLAVTPARFAEMRAGKTVVNERRMRRKDGVIVRVEISAKVLDDGRMQAIARDITERKQAEEALRASEARLALQYAAAAILSASATLDAAIPALLRAVGERSDWALGAFWCVDAEGATLRRAHIWHAPSDALAGFAEASRGTRLARGVGLPGRVWADAAPAWVPDVTADANFPRAAAAARAGVHAAVCVPIPAGGAIYGALEFFSTDIQPPHTDIVQALATIGTHIGQFVERARADEAVRHQAMHDALTDLPNRTLLHARVVAALGDAPDDPRPLALVLLDLDRFKEVNDTFGHERGDALLQEVADRLGGAVRAGDTVARLGGDEFAVLLPGADAAGAVRVAENIHAALDAPLHVEGQALQVGASMGIALGPVHGADGTTLLRHADVAMYAAKRGRTRHAVYDPAQDQHSPERLALVGELRAAIEEGALVLHYQPQVDLASGRVCGVEALVRWPHPERGLVPPDQFIPLAEQTGLIAPLTEWVLGEAMRQARVWQRAGLLLAVSVNLSMWNLHDPALPERVAGLLREHSLPPAWLRLELTESALMTDPERALDVLTRLAGLGVRLAVDDFGAGYSSLAYLKKLPVDELKIDQGFVRALATDATDAAIVASTVGLGHALGLRVVAEGIENRATWDRLAGMGCDVAQGYYMSRPLPADALARWLRESSWAVA